MKALFCVIISVLICILDSSHQVDDVESSTEVRFILTGHLIPFLLCGGFNLVDDVHTARSNVNDNMGPRSRS